MAEGFDVHGQKSGKQAKESTLQDKCRAAVLGATGIEKAEDLRGKLNLPAPLISFLTKQFGSDDFFINSEDVTAEDISSETYNAVCTLNNQSVMLKCIPTRAMNEETSELVQNWRNKELSGIQKCLVSFDEGQKEIFVLQGDLQNLKQLIDDMKCKDKRAEEVSLWELLEKVAKVLQGLQNKQLHYKDLDVGKICLDKAGQVSLYNPIRYITENANNDPFAISESGSSAIYTPPEIISGEESTIKSNIWVLGCALYEVAMQKPAYTTDGSDIFASLNDIVEGKKPESLTSTFSADLQSMIWSCLQVQMHERPKLETLLMKAEEKLKNVTESSLQKWLE